MIKNLLCLSTILDYSGINVFVCVIFYLDLRMSRVGKVFPRHLPTTSEMLQVLLGNAARTYVLTGYEVQEEGYLAVLEFIVTQPGPIRIQVGIICIGRLLETRNYYLWMLSQKS